MAPSSTSQILAALLLLVATCFAETVSLRGALRDRIIALSTRANGPLPPIPVEQYRFLPPVSSTQPEPGNDLELLDICLIASVDGKFHALNRTSGQMLWSMSSSPSSSSSSSSPAALSPLVRTQHEDGDTASDESDHHEMYIIEPQSGDIYVLSAPDAPLQRLPFSMSQLVDMSPFSFPGEEDRRMFVGKKETSLLLIELETGRLKGTVNSECPWDPFGDIDDEQSSAELDLDELDGTKPAKEKPVSTEVLIGRTDYYISIHTRPLSPSSHKPPIQNLSFSVYGPNNQDHAIQSSYRRTSDDTYIQSLPNGEILSFRTGQPTGRDSRPTPESQPLWGNSFSSPIVVVFDVLLSPSRQHPLVLLQPRPRLQDVLPSFDLPNVDTFIGLVDDSGSLFAMSPDRYPLVVFHSNPSPSSPSPRRPAIEAPPGTVYEDLPPDLDSVTKLRKERERCKNAPWDRRCLRGLRPVEESDRSRLGRLLDGVPSAPVPEELTDNKEDATYPDFGADGNTSNGVPRIGEQWDNRHERTFGDRLRRQVIPASGAVAAFALFLIGFWYVTRKQGKHAKIAGVTVGSNEPLRSREAITDEVSSPSTNGNATGSAEPLLANAEIEAADTPNLTQNFAQALATSLPPTPAPNSTVEFPELMQPSKSASSEPAEDAEGGDDDSEREGDNPRSPAGKKRGTRRRRRGQKNKGSNAAKGQDSAGDLNGINGVEKEEEEVEAVAPLASPSVPIVHPVPAVPLLAISEEVLGFGSHGTVVFRGSLQGRAVAVKRLLHDFVTLASREVDILQESDDHPNVIRYFYQEAHANFLYIALELCPASLADIVERPDLPAFRSISNSFDPKRALREITAGIRHLHALKIIHRDIKPQNILISAAKKGAGEARGHRMLISDFGLCKKLEVDQTSFLPTAHGAMAAGTVGWRAPEILRGEVKLDESVVDDHSQSSRSSTGTALNGKVPSKLTRLTKSVDIFALGCLFYFTLTAGSHPFGDRFEREVNILKDAKALTGLETFGEEGLEAVDLITKMLDPEASRRPDTTACLMHPFFWTPARRLGFLQDASDRFEIMCRDPREPDLVALETGAFGVVGNDWHSRLDKVVIDNLGKFRKYDGRSVQDLMRALRNKKHHYQDLPENVKRHFGPLPEGFLAYFTRRFPHLFMHVHSVVSHSNLRYESMFKSYFEFSD